MYKSPDKIIADSQDKILSEYEVRRYLIAVKQRQWERQIAGEILLLQELFGIVPGERPRFIRKLRKCQAPQLQQTQ